MPPDFAIVTKSNSIKRWEDPEIACPSAPGADTSSREETNPTADEFGMTEDHQEREQVPKSASSGASASLAGFALFVEQACSCSHRPLVIPSIIVVLGMAASAAFLYLGISSAITQSNGQFVRSAQEATREIQEAWNDYETAAMWVHGEFRSEGRNVSRQAFRELYEHLMTNQISLSVQAIEFIPNVTRDERRAAEEETREFLRQNYPDVTYTGFKGFEPDPNGTSEDGEPVLSIQPRSEQDFYFPVQFVEPIVGNEAALGFDLYSRRQAKFAIDQALSSWKPAVTEKLRLVQETDPSAYSVLLMHPGIPLSTRPEEYAPKDLSLLVVRIPDLLRRATFQGKQSLILYIFDCKGHRSIGHSHSCNDEDAYLGSAKVTATDGDSALISGEESTLYQARARSSRYVEEEFKIAGTTWLALVAAADDSYEPQLLYVILGGTIIFVACTAIAVWVYASNRRAKRLTDQKALVESEKAALIIENARKAAEAERDLNGTSLQACDLLCRSLQYLTSL